MILTCCCSVDDVVEVDLGRHFGGDCHSGRRAAVRIEVDIFAGKEEAFVVDRWPARRSQTDREGWGRDLLHLSKKSSKGAQHVPDCMPGGLRSSNARLGD